MLHQPTQDVMASCPVRTLYGSLAMNHNETVLPAPKQTGVARGLAMANHNETVLPAPKQTGVARGLAMSNHNETVIPLGA
jgi:hypothetical protein